MKLRPLLSPARRRRRRWVWTGAAVVVAAVWVSSSQWCLAWVSPYTVARIERGAAVFSWKSDGWRRPGAGHFEFLWFPGIVGGGGAREGWRYWRDYLWPHFVATVPPTDWDGTLPLWMILVPMLVPTARSWLAEAIGPGMCSRCGYDLTGLAADKGGACPECGAVRATGATA